MESVPEQKKVEVVSGEAAPAGEGLRLFGAGAVGVGSLVGTPVAGGILLAMNAVRVGQRVGALMGLAMGGLLTFTLLGLLPYVPGSGGIWLLLPVGAVVMWWVAGALQGDWLARRRAGGRGRELLVALAMGVLVAGGVYFAVRPYVVRKAAGVPVRSVMMAEKQGVNYVAPVTEEEARRVGTALVDVKYFDQSGQARAVFMAGDEQGRTVIVFPGDPAKAKEPQTLKEMAVLAQAFVRGGVRMPFTIRLVGNDGAMLNEVKVAITPATTRTTTRAAGAE